MYWFIVLTKRGSCEGEVRMTSQHRHVKCTLCRNLLEKVTHVNGYYMINLTPAYSCTDRLLAFVIKYVASLYHSFISHIAAALYKHNFLHWWHVYFYHVLLLVAMDTLMFPDPIFLAYTCNRPIAYNISPTQYHWHYCGHLSDVWLWRTPTYCLSTEQFNK